MKHSLYKTCHADKPECICDKNGEVVLGLCRICGKGEAELSEPCKTHEGYMEHIGKLTERKTG